MMAAEFKLFGFIYPTIRFFHRVQLADQISSTQYFASVLFQSTLFNFIKPYIAIGWYFRFTKLNFPFWVPQIIASDTIDKNFAAKIGFTFFLSQKINFDIHMSSFDKFRVHNFNNPFFKGQVNYKWNENWAFNSMFRYQVLLGFGRMHEWAFGVGAVKNF